MAIRIATDFELITLKVTVRPRDAGMSAWVELVTYEGGKPTTRGEWWLSSTELALPTRLTPQWRPTDALPPAFVEALGHTVDALSMPAGLPLWLHLVKPYGFLGAVDWEGALVRPLGRPLLRLPDFLEAPRECRSVLDVALCCSEPVSEPRLDPPALLHDIAQAVLVGSRREHTSIHVFADQIYYSSLRSRFANEPRVAVHDPETARRHGVLARGGNLKAEPQGLRNPWLLWMRDSMRGRSLDAVHFVVHGYLADDRAAIALAESPLSNRDRADARYVGAAELATFLTQTGAWSAVFSSPPANYSEAGLRLLADTLAQARPGPVLYRPVQQGFDPKLQALYGFLYAPDPTPVPEPNGWFAYCQPAIVRDQAPTRPSSGASAAVDANASLFVPPLSKLPRARSPAMVPDGPPDIPSWVSAAQRYVEQASQDLQRRSDSSPGTLTASANAAAAEAERTLQKLQAIVASVAQKAPSQGQP